MAVNGLYHEPLIKEELQGMTTVWSYPTQTIRDHGLVYAVTRPTGKVTRGDDLMHWTQQYSRLT